MEKIIDLMPHLERSAAKQSAVYAVISIPAVCKKPARPKRSLLRTVAHIVDVAISFSLGAILLVFLLLMVISL